jgi:hypothetical protein
MKITPGDRVRITEDALEYWIDWWWLCASKGSIARAISLEEYAEIIKSQSPPGRNHSPDQVKHWMEQDDQYPFLFETVAPSNLDELDAIGATCFVGSVVVLDHRFFELIRE